MKNPTQNQLIKALNGLESQVEYVRSLVQEAVPEKEWLDTKEFAHRAKLNPRTVSNYAGKGRFKKTRKTATGHYLIHISELEQWSQ